MLEVHFSYLY